MIRFYFYFYRQNSNRLMFLTTILCSQLVLIKVIFEYNHIFRTARFCLLVISLGRRELIYGMFPREHAVCSRERLNINQWRNISSIAVQKIFYWKLFFGLVRITFSPVSRSTIINALRIPSVINRNSFCSSSFISLEITVLSPAPV